MADQARARRAMSTTIRMRCRAACASACRSRAPLRPTPTSCCATSRFQRWTNPPPAGCAREFVRLVKENSKTAVFITHSISEALQIGDRIVVLKRPAMIAYDVSFDKDTVARGAHDDPGADRRGAGGLIYGNREAKYLVRK